MDQKTIFTVEAFWDSEAEVWCSRSDIQGLVIETDTLDEFEELIPDIAIECIVQNHWGGRLPEGAPLTSIIPTIIWKRPHVEAA